VETLIKWVAGIFLLGLGLLGPGGLIAGVEYPFGAGPFTTEGRYCTAMHTFAATTKNDIANPTKANAKQLVADVKQMINKAFDSSVKSEFEDWISAQVAGSQADVNTATTNLNQWMSNHCSSVAYKFPFQLNSWYGGLLNGTGW
jgi:hypothetical protein